MALYVIANNDYLTDGYVTDNFVGTDSDLYVNVGYTQDTIEGSAALSASASATAKGGFLIDSGSITSSVSITVTTADGDATLVGVSIPAGAFSTAVDGDRIAGATSSISTNATTSTDADRIAGGVVSLSPAFTTGVTANAIVSPGGDISVSATVSSSAVANLVGVVDINAFQTHPTLWSSSATWDDPQDIVWGPMVETFADAFAQGQSSISTSATLTADGDVTAIANISPAGAFTVDVTGQFEVVGSADLSVSATVTAQGTTNVVSENVQIASAASLVANGIFQVNSQPIAISSSGTLVVDADRIASGVATPQANATVQATPSRTRPFVANLTSSFSLTSDATATTDATVIQAGSFTTTVDAIKAVFAEASMSSNFQTTRWVGGKLNGGIIDIQAFTVQVSALTIYIIDPFRVYTIDSESRLLGIEEERRIYTPNSETRVNSIIEEIREFNVPSETRTLKTQHKKLVEVAGDPLDRRE
tara:strand:- start:14672 stop:16105 length:1434 start_codon:yes stop_codon:yes gene_type:complete